MAKKSIWFWGCLGCGGFLLLVFIIIGAGVGWVGYNAMQYGQQFQEMYTQINTQYTELNEEFPFSPPQDGLIPEERYTEFLQVRQELTAFSQEYVKQFEEISQKISQNFEGGFMDMFAGISSIKQIIDTAVKLFPEIGGKHVELLRQREMSKREYIWICRTTLGTLSKCQENNHTEGQQVWSQYEAQFHEVEKTMQEINSNNQQWNNQDFDFSNLREAVQSVDFKAENADLIVKNKDALLEPTNAPALDFFTVNFDQMMNDLSQQTNAGNQAQDTQAQDTQAQDIQAE